jgi:hypothetical protein
MKLRNGGLFQNEANQGNLSPFRNYRIITIIQSYDLKVHRFR